MEHESFTQLLILFCNINLFLGGRSFSEVSARGHSSADRSGEQEWTTGDGNPASGAIQGNPAAGWFFKAYICHQ